MFNNSRSKITIDQLLEPPNQYDQLRQQVADLTAEVIELKDERDAYQRIAISIVRSRGTSFEGIRRQVKTHMSEHTKPSPSAQKVIDAAIDLLNDCINFNGAELSECKLKQMSEALNEHQKEGK